MVLLIKSTTSTSAAINQKLQNHPLKAYIARSLYMIEVDWPHTCYTGLTTSFKRRCFILVLDAVVHNCKKQPGDNWPRPLPWRPIIIRSSVMIQTGDSLRGFDSWLKCPDVQMFRGYYLKMFLLCKVIGLLSAKIIVVRWSGDLNKPRFWSLPHQNKLMATTACMGQQQHQWFILAAIHLWKFRSILHPLNLYL